MLRHASSIAAPALLLLALTLACDVALVCIAPFGPAKAWRAGGIALLVTASF